MSGEKSEGGKRRMGESDRQEDQDRARLSSNGVERATVCAMLRSTLAWGHTTVYFVLNPVSVARTDRTIEFT
jgi:hypothetical protein